MGTRKAKFFLQSISRHSPGKPFTEATITEAISRWLFRGHGEKYLSLPICDDFIGRPINCSPRRFWCPTTRTNYARWKPLKDHVTGDPKGLVADERTSLVPFLAVDIDRHSGQIPAKQHQHVAIQVGRQLRRISHVKWLAEVNPNNGSLKFFGFKRVGMHFRLDEAKAMASEIRRDLISQDLCHDGNVEVFPDNCKAVYLPLRRDKTTIVDGGILTTCFRKVRDYTVYPQRVMENITCYSALHFAAWIYEGDNYDEATLTASLSSSCAELPDELTTEKFDPVVAKQPVVARSPAGSELANQRTIKPVTPTNSNGQNDPSAFNRNWQALLPFTRQFYKLNKAFPSVNDALHYLKDNNLYSGQWSDNERHRRNRVADILNKIHETFDPSLLKSHQEVKLDPGIRRWCRRHHPNGLVGQQRRINEMDMTSIIKDIHVPARFVEHAVGVIGFCLNDPLDNDALPVNRIMAIWNLVPDAPSWNQTYFQVVRHHLEKIGVVDIYDKNHCAGKAWRWRKGENFPQKMRERRRSGCSNESSSCKLSDIKSLCETVETIRLSTGGAREWGGKGVEKEYTHNSLYHLPLQNPVTTIRNSHYRGPPRSKGPDWHLTLSNSLN